MNILIDELPTKIEINNRIYPIDANFRNCIKIMEAFEDDELTNMEKYYVMLELLYEEMPSQEDLDIAIEKAVKFLNGGENSTIKEKFEDFQIENQKEERVYSFSKDAKYIYSAFQQTHKIDLEQVDFMHWWKFLCLFLDLNRECFFSQMIYLRKQKQRGKLTDEERRTYYEMREILDLNYVPEEEREKSEFEILLEAGENDE